MNSSAICGSSNVAPGGAGSWGHESDEQSYEKETLCWVVAERQNSPGPRPETMECKQTGLAASGAVLGSAITTFSFPYFGRGRSGYRAEVLQSPSRPSE